MAFLGIRRSIISVSSTSPSLTNLLAEEKDKVTALNGMQCSLKSSSKFLAAWSEEQSIDIQDITKQLSYLDEQESLLWAGYEETLTQSREMMRALKEGQDYVATIRAKLKSATEKVAKLIRSNKNAEQAHAEVDLLQMQLEDEEADFEGKKRNHLLNVIQLKAQGLNIFASQLHEVAQAQSYISELIPQFQITSGQAVPLYKASVNSEKIIRQFDISIYEAKKMARLKRYAVSIPKTHSEEEKPISNIAPDKPTRQPVVGLTEQIVQMEPLEEKISDSLPASVGELEIENPW